MMRRAYAYGDTGRAGKGSEQAGRCEPDVVAAARMRELDPAMPAGTAGIAQCRKEWAQHAAQARVRRTCGFRSGFHRPPEYETFFCAYGVYVHRSTRAHQRSPVLRQLFPAAGLRRADEADRRRMQGACHFPGARLPAARSQPGGWARGGVVRESALSPRKTFQACNARAAQARLPDPARGVPRPACTGGNLARCPAFPG